MKCCGDDMVYVEREDDDRFAYEWVCVWCSHIVPDNRPIQLIPGMFTGTYPPEKYGRKVKTKPLKDFFRGTESTGPR